MDAALAADESAASTVEAQIGALPIQANLTLSDQASIEEVRATYNTLTASQQSLVSNLSLSTLAAAEAAIAVLEASLTDVAVLSAFSNVEGNMITLKLSSALNQTYSMQGDNFQVFVNGDQVSVANANYDLTDFNLQTIKLTLSSPVLLNETLATISIRRGAFKTSNNELNNEIHSVPVITFKKLDLSHDNEIGIDDVVQMISNSTLHIEVNQDGVFDREDIRSILGQISSYVQ